MNSATEADPLAEISVWLGRETEHDGVDEVTLNDIRHKLEVYCFDCPLHYDAEVAQAHGYRTVVAPVAMTGLWMVSPYWTPGEPPPAALWPLALVCSQWQSQKNRRKFVLKPFGTKTWAEMVMNVDPRNPDMVLLHTVLCLRGG